MCSRILGASGLAAVVGGAMRAPLTGTVFTLGLTHAWPALIPSDHLLDHGYRHRC